MEKKEEAFAKESSMLLKTKHLLEMEKAIRPVLEKFIKQRTII